ncbi:hypothetical protein HPB47_000043, partial [Ixodes persulcatus]
RTDRITELASPPGYSSSLGQGHAEASRETEANLIVKKSWDVALAPWKQVPMNLFIMYMAGNSISIFPIMMVGMLFLRPVKALLTIQSSPYLIVIVDRRRVGEINGQVIWRIKATEAYSYTKTSLHLTEEQIQYNKQYTAMVQSVLSTPNFYYSTTYDLSHTLQRLYNTTPDFLQMGLMERADYRFVWNHYLMSEFSNQVELQKFCLPIIHGFVYIKTCAINGRGFTFALISRRSCYRAGTRMFMRGLDSEGHAANFVETEQIIEGDSARSSFVQTRGSIPLFWSQLPDLRYKPPPTLSNGYDHLQGFQKHFDNQIFTYGKQVIINLIDQKGPEKSLGKALQDVSTIANNSNIKYEPFDFHHECRKMQWDRLSILMDRIQHDQDSFGFFMMLYDGSVPLVQDGVFRTNCIDCLDRTNVVQSLLARRSFEQQMLDAIDLFLGNYRVQDGEGASTPCPLTVRRDLKYLALPSFLLLAIACCFMCLLIPSVYSMETFMYFLFWFMMIVLTLFAIVLNGTEFVDFPKLRDLRPRRRQD